jgi:hypothetical protein
MVGEAFHRAPDEQDAMKPEGEGLTLGLDSRSQKGANHVEVRRGGAQDIDRFRRR